MKDDNMKGNNDLVLVIEYATKASFLEGVKKGHFASYGDSDGGVCLYSQEAFEEASSKNLISESDLIVILDIKSIKTVKKVSLLEDAK